MASSQVIFMQCILLIGFFLISGTNGEFDFSEKITADVINSICAEVPNKGYCSSVLNSDPRIKIADPKAVAGILLEKAYLDATATQTKAAFLANKETIAQLKQRYSVVAAYHSVVADRINQAKGNLNDLNNVYNQAQAALVKVYSCEDLFLFPALKEPTDLLTRVTNLDTLLNMIMADVDLAR